MKTVRRSDHSPIHPLLFKMGWTLAVLAILAGCNVGPRYIRPDLPAAAPTAYKENRPGSAQARANGWRQANPRDEMLRGDWWKVFHDQELNALEAKLVINNQNIKQAFENYMASLAAVRYARSSLYPTISTNPSVTATGTRNGSTTSVTSTGTTTTGTNTNTGTGTGTTGTGTGTGTTTTGTGTTGTASFGTTSSGGISQSYSLPLSVSWEPDFFGRVRNTIRENANAAQVSAATLANTTLSEQSSLAQYYFELRGQDALQALYDRTVASYQESLKLTQTLFRTGIDTDQDVAQAELNLRTAEANASSVTITRAQYEHAIALLLGQAAGNFSIRPRALRSLPPHVPTGVPSRLLERRPDIAAAERTMAEANALIGVGKAAYYPDISLSGSLGTSSTEFTKLFNVSNGFWSVGASVAETILSFGARRSTVQQYEAQYNANVASYRQTVLNGFKEVEDYLVANRQLAEQSKRQQLAVDAALRYLKLAEVRYKTGVDTYLNVITAQNSALSTQQTMVTLDTNRMTSAVQLIAALGGGWNASDLPSEAQASRGVQRGSAPFNPL